MVRIELLHTAHVPARTLVAARALLDDAFDGDFDDADRDHALGGLHALAWADGELVGHGAVVQRRLLHGGRAPRRRSWPGPRTSSAAAMTSAP